MLFGSKLIFLREICKLLILANFGLSSSKMLSHSVIHWINIIMVHLLKLWIFLIMLKLLMSICLIYFFSIDWKLHGHILSIATHWWVICFCSMSLVSNFLNTHKRTQASNRADRSYCWLVFCKNILLIALHHLIPMLSSLLTWSNSTNFLLNYHIEVFLLLLCLVHLFLWILF